MENKAVETNSRPTVMVVDDEDMVRELVRHGLQARGYEVNEAVNGEQALNYLDACSSLPSLVILDLRMPVMGGDELLPVLASKFPGLKILVSSGYSERQVRRSILSGSVAGFLEKPYTVAELAAKVEEVLQARQ